MLVYGGLLLVVILALLGIVLLLRETKQSARKAQEQAPSPATQADLLAQDTQVNKVIAHQSSPALQARHEMEGVNSSSTFSPPSNVTSVQSLPRVEAIPLVTRSTGIAPRERHAPHAAHLTRMDDDRIVLTAGQFGALLSELNALRQRSEEVAERLDIVSETLEQMAPTQIEFPAISFKPSPDADTPGSAQRGRQFIG